MRQRLKHLGVHALVNARHRDQHCGPHGLQVFAQQGHRARIGHAAARRHGQVVAAGAFKGVRQRQEGQEHILWHGGDARQHRLDVRDHVGVGQHHPLGFSGGAAGVNDGRQIFRLGRRGQCLRRRGLGQPGRQCRDGRPLHGRLGGKVGSGRMGRVGYHHLLQVRQWRADVADALPLLRLGDDEQRNLCILQDIGDAARVVDGVQRHRHAAGGQHGLVNAHRVQPIRQQDGDTRPQGQVRRGQGTAPVGHPLLGLRPAQAGPLPGSGVEMPVSLGFGGLGGTPGQQLGQGVDGAQIGDGGSHADRCIRSAPGRVGPGDLQMIALRPFFTGAAAWRRGCIGL